MSLPSQVCGRKPKSAPASIKLASSSSKVTRSVRVKRGIQLTVQTEHRVYYRCICKLASHAASTKFTSCLSPDVRTPPSSSFGCTVVLHCNHTRSSHFAFDYTYIARHNDWPCFHTVTSNDTYANGLKFRLASSRQCIGARTASQQSSSSSRKDIKDTHAHAKCLLILLHHYQGHHRPHISE